MVNLKNCLEKSELGTENEKKTRHKKTPRDKKNEKPPHVDQEVNGKKKCSGFHIRDRLYYNPIVSCFYHEPYNVKGIAIYVKSRNKDI